MHLLQQNPWVSLCTKKQSSSNEIGLKYLNVVKEIGGEMKQIVHKFKLQNSNKIW